MTSPFHFPSLVWGESIAIYLFLLGISAGATMMVLLFKKTGVISGDLAQNNLIKVNAFLAPISVTIGLILLIFHLARPWTFWYLMFNYSTTSIMSVGVMLFQLYFACLILWLVNIFQKPLQNIIKNYIPRLENFVVFALNIIARIINFVEYGLLFVSIALGAYTGFLLSALISYPMLNNPVLPILFLISGTSSGIAALSLFTLHFTKESPHSTAFIWLHKIEQVVLLIELFLLFALFFGLYLGGGQKTVAFYTALGQGFWSYVFWIGVVLIGILMPLSLNKLVPENWRHRKVWLSFLASITLFGVLCLRFFILYAGQMTLA